MEFGIFIQMYTPNHRRARTRDAEHNALNEDLEAVIAADKAGFKYVWVTEHHFLDEYSHLSANDAVLGYLAHATERIHLGSGIFNPLPQVNHPAKVAETGRHARPPDRTAASSSAPAAARAATRSSVFCPGMTTSAGPGRSGKTSSASSPRCGPRTPTRATRASTGRCRRARCCPSRGARPHPPMWYAAGNTSSYEMAARKGLGVLGFRSASSRRSTR